VSSPEVKKKSGGSTIASLADVKAYKDTKDPKRMRMKAISRDKTDEFLDIKDAEVEDDQTLGTRESWVE
jgi:hypothetical protein